jgi:hypothetical protein
MRTLILLLVSSGLGSQAPAQRISDALLDRLTSVRPGSATSADCARQVAEAAKLNGPDLLYGAAVCSAAGRAVEGSFLLNAGQTRSMADLALTMPASKADSDVQTSLYGILYFHAGGPGSEEVLRDASSRDRLFRLLDSWSPSYSSDYNPGWNVRRRPEAAEYSAAIAELKAHRREQLDEVARLYSDTAYYALHRRHQDLQARNSNGFIAGTPDADLSRELLRQMSERSAALGIGTADDDTARPDPSDLRFPPPAPGAEELVLPSSSDPVVRRCADSAERWTIAADTRVLRVLITKSPEWGTIWRADIAGGDRPAERFTCTSDSTSSRPLAGEDTIPPLP